MAARTHPDPITGCWNFSGCKVGPNGYGQILRENGKAAYAHRVAWEFAHPGESIPDHLRVLHSCDNPRCVNPAHLSLGTQKENIRDAVRKGRWTVRKLSDDDVDEIRAMARTGALHKDIARHFHVARNTVTSIVNGAARTERLERPTQPIPSQPEQPRGAFDLPHGPFEFVASVQLPIVGEVR